MVTENDRLTMAALKQAFTRCKISPFLFSIGRKKEGSTCLMESEGSWCVFDCGKDRIYEIRTFSNLRMACRNLIDRISENSWAADVVKKEFDEAIRSLRTK